MLFLVHSFALALFCVAYARDKNKARFNHPGFTAFSLRNDCSKGRLVGQATPSHIYKNVCMYVFILKLLWPITCQIHILRKFNQPKDMLHEQLKHQKNDHKSKHLSNSNKWKTTRLCPSTTHLFQNISEDQKDWWQENVNFEQQLSVPGNHISVNSLGPGTVNELDTKVSLQHYVHLCSKVWHL